MNKAFEKILEKLDEMIHPEQLYFCKYARGGCKHLYNNDKDCMDCVVELAKETVQEVAEEYNNGWIPCSERLPEPNQKVIVTYMDRYIGGSYGVCEGQYVYILNSWDISDYMSDDDFEVIAWRPLPKPFKEEKNE